MMKAKNDAIYGAMTGDVIGSVYEFKGARFEPIKFFKLFCHVIKTVKQNTYFIFSV